MAIIYCNSKKKVEWLADLMREQNFEVSCITGDMQEDERNFVMKQFRNGVTRVLLTTDLLSRGIDVQQVSLVLNYDIPFEKETYIHRIKEVVAMVEGYINFATAKDYKQFKDIESFYDTHIEELPENIAEYYNFFILNHIRINKVNLHFLYLNLFFKIFICKYKWNLEILIKIFHNYYWNYYLN